MRRLSWLLVALGLAAGCQSKPERHKACATTCMCSEQGRCGYAGGECVAISQEDCEKSDGCTTLGRCSLVEGRCAIARNEDCARSVLCTRSKACTFVAGPPGRCAR